MNSVLIFNSRNLFFPVVLVLAAALFSGTGSACTLSVSPSTFALDNQGTTFSGSQTLTVTPSAGCGSWSVSTQGTIPNGQGVQTSWFALNTTAANCPASGSFGSVTATGNGTGSVTVAICPNPIQSNIQDASYHPLTSGGVQYLAARTGSLIVSDSTPGTPSITIPVSSYRTQQIFSDLPPAGNYYFDAVNMATLRHIYTPPSYPNYTNNCTPGPYACAGTAILRDEMAQWVIRSIYGSDDFQYSATAHFTDVSSTQPFFKWIQAMYELGITAGCGANTYCPSSTLTRAEMAVFVIRARFGGAQAFTYPSTPYFSDVPANGFGFQWIQRLRLDEITTGCGNGVFCPSSSITRGDLAVFMMRGVANQLQADLPLQTGSTTTCPGSTSSVATAPCPIVTSLSKLNIYENATSSLTLTGSYVNWLEDPPVVSVLGCTAQPTTSCPGATATVTSQSVTGPGTVNFNVSVGGGLTSGYQAIPQSILVSYTDSGGSHELVLPNVLRVLDKSYINVALPSTWVQIINSGDQVQFQQASSTLIDDLTMAAPFLNPTSANLTTTPRPPYSYSFSALSTPPPSNLETCPLTAQTNYDATHSLVYTNIPNPPYGTNSSLFTQIETILLPGNSAQPSSSGSNLFTPVSGVKGFLLLGQFTGNATSAKGNGGLGEAIWFTDQGCEAANREYGFTTDILNIPGIIQFYYSDYTNCPAQNSLTRCHDRNSASIYQIQGAVNIQFPDYPATTDSQNSYFYGAYLVPDSSPQGYRFRVEVVDPGTYAYTTCTMTLPTGTQVVSNGPCVTDLPLSLAANKGAGLPFTTVSPDFAERLFNSNGYITATSVISLESNGTIPTFTSGAEPAGLYTSGIYVAQ